ncbi:hypothetical protein BDZ97DRAFT_648191 [Flammula alnicola]|nr:hypothetical protein BDZ97DRAFT_648191 [Flammula alnicola]
MRNFTYVIVPALSLLNMGVNAATIANALTSRRDGNPEGSGTYKLRGMSTHHDRQIHTADFSSSTGMEASNDQSPPAGAAPEVAPLARRTLPANAGNIAGLLSSRGSGVSAIDSVDTLLAGVLGDSLTRRVVPIIEAITQRTDVSDAAVTRDLGVETTINELPLINGQVGRREVDQLPKELGSAFSVGDLSLLDVQRDTDSTLKSHYPTPDEEQKRQLDLGLKAPPSSLRNRMVRRTGKRQDQSTLVDDGHLGSGEALDVDDIPMHLNRGNPFLTSRRSCFSFFLFLFTSHSQLILILCIPLSYNTTPLLYFTLLFTADSRSANLLNSLRQLSLPCIVGFVKHLLLWTYVGMHGQLKYLWAAVEADLL